MSESRQGTFRMNPPLWPCGQYAERVGSRAHKPGRFGCRISRACRPRVFPRHSGSGIRTYRSIRSSRGTKPAGWRVDVPVSRRRVHVLLPHMEMWRHGDIRLQLRGGRAARQPNSPLRQTGHALSLAALMDRCCSCGKSATGAAVQACGGVGRQERPMARFRVVSPREIGRRWMTRIRCLSGQGLPH